mgnify:CR=1 FL=1
MTIQTADQRKNRMVEIRDELSALKTTAQNEKRDMSAAEQKQAKNLFNEFQSLEVDLTVDSLSPGRTSAPSIPGKSARLPGVSGSGSNSSKLLFAEQQKGPLLGRRCSDLFGSAASDADGWDSMSEFFRTVHHGLHHEKLKNASMTEGVGQDGGFLVPSQLIASMFDASLENEIIRPRASVFPMASNELVIAGVDVTDRTSNIGGLDAVWMSEDSTATKQKAQWRNLTLRAKKLGIFVKASNELASDALNFDQQITRAMSNALAFDLDYSFLWGTGTGQPTGLMNCASTVSVSKDTSTSPVQAADTITFTNVVAMWSRLHPSCHARAIWIAHPDVVPSLYTMSFEGSSSSVPAFMPAGSGITGQAVSTLFGREIIFSEKAATLGDQGDLILVDPTSYAIGMRMEATLQRSIHESWTSDGVDYRLIVRCTGESLWDAPVTPKNGASTLAPCVVLDARA